MDDDDDPDDVVDGYADVATVNYLQFSFSFWFGYSSLKQTRAEGKKKKKVGRDKEEGSDWSHVEVA